MITADGFLTGTYQDKLGELSATITGDLNGDGYLDMALGLDDSLGASDVEAGAIWLVPGGTVPDGDARSLAFAELHGEFDGDALGSAVAAVDLDSDGSTPCSWPRGARTSPPRTPVASTCTTRGASTAC